MKVLLEKVIQKRRFSYHCQILVCVLLRSFALFIAPDGIAGFGIALATVDTAISFSALSFYQSTD